MYDQIKIVKIIKDIESEFEKLNGFGLDEKSDDKTVYASSMAMISIIGRSIDLAEEIIMKNEWGMPQRYRDYFALLKKHGIIDENLGRSMEGLADWRNTFAHEYFDLDKKKVIKLKKNVHDVKQLIEKIKKEVAKSVKK